MTNIFKVLLSVILVAVVTLSAIAFIDSREKAKQEHRRARFVRNQLSIMSPFIDGYAELLSHGALGRQSKSDLGIEQYLIYIRKSKSNKIDTIAIVNGQIFQSRSLNAKADIIDTNRLSKAGFTRIVSFPHAHKDLTGVLEKDGARIYYKKGSPAN